MKASEACFDLIRKSEGFQPAAYRCPAGVLTIGYGHTAGVSAGQKVSQMMAGALLSEDVERIEADLAATFPGVEWTQGAWDALVSLGFNLKGGPAALPKKAPKLTAAVRRADWHAAGLELLNICHANGLALPGLMRRRRAEYELMTGEKC